MAQRPNPLHRDVVTSVRLGSSESEERERLTYLIDAGLRADADRSSWLERQRSLTKLRYSIRKPKTFPWPGCSNLGIPYIDAVIRKIKPIFMRLLVEADPIVEFQGEDPQAVESERLAEETYNWLFKTEMDALESCAYLIDQFCHRGHTFGHIGWNYETELECRIADIPDLFPGGIPQDGQQIASVLAGQYELDLSQSSVLRQLESSVRAIQNGARNIKIAFKHVVNDRPALWDRDAVQILAPPRTTDYGSAEWLVVQHLLPLRKLQRLEADGFLDRDACSKIYEDIKRRGVTNRHMDETSGTTGLLQERDADNEKERIFGIEDEDNVLVWEVYTWADIDNDGLLDRAHCWIHPRSRCKLTARPFVYPFHQWPIVKFDFEKTNRRLHSPRGISAMLEGLQREINAQHNFRLDGMTLRNAQSYQTQSIAGFKSRNFRLVPGTILQLPAGMRLDPLIQDRGSFPEQAQEENLLRALGEQYIGVLDPILSSVTSTTKARTATEVQAAVQTAAATATMDTILFQLTMRKVHTLIWELFLDLGPKEVFIKYLGEEDASRVGRLVKKSEIARKYKLIPTGTIANTNRALELAQSREALQLYLNDQTGYVNPFELRRWHLNLLDYRWARRILNSPQDAQHLQVLRQAAQAVQSNPELQQTLLGSAQPPPAEAPPQQEVAQVEESL